MYLVLQEHSAQSKARHHETNVLNAHLEAYSHSVQGRTAQSAVRAHISHLQDRRHVKCALLARSVLYRGQHLKMFVQSVRQDNTQPPMEDLIAFRVGGARTNRCLEGETVYRARLARSVTYLGRRIKVCV